MCFHTIGLRVLLSKLGISNRKVSEMSDGTFRKMRDAAMKRVAAVFGIALCALRPE